MLAFTIGWWFTRSWLSPRPELPEEVPPLEPLDTVWPEAAALAAIEPATEEEEEEEEEESLRRPSGNRYHVVLTASDAVYMQWQTEIFYYWYRKHKEAHPDSDLGGFTRVLHAAADDHLSALVPTVRVDPLDHPGVARFPPLQRPHALRQFLRAADIEEDYIFMAEPDHIMIAPPPNWAAPLEPAAFPFGYIDFAQNAELVARWNKKDVPLADLYPVGNSPVVIHKAQLAAILEIWPQLTVEMYEHDATREAFGWVLEMWSFAFAASQVPEVAGGPVQFRLHPEFMVEPPWNDPRGVVDRCDVRSPPEPDGCAPRKAWMVHYTFGMFYTDAGERLPVEAWPDAIRGPKIRGCALYAHPLTGPCYGFEKRLWINGYPPAGLKEPPPKLQETNPVVYTFLEMVREAAADNMSGRFAAPPPMLPAPTPEEVRQAELDHIAEHEAAGDFRGAEAHRHDAEGGEGEAHVHEHEHGEGEHGQEHGHVHEHEHEHEHGEEAPRGTIDAEGGNAQALGGRRGLVGPAAETVGSHRVF